MGRLTLNVLLSFAQFEREVIGERVRDKIHASKQKGLWVGGPVPLGYRSRDKKLMVDEDEASLVRRIFGLYLELGSIGAVVARLDTEGIRSRKGYRFGPGATAALLKNRFYCGEILWKGQVHPGEHAGIVERDVFDAVQRQMANFTVQRRQKAQNRTFTLAGLLYDDAGNRMSPSHARKDGVRYRYYVSQAILQHRRAEAGTIARISAPEIEVAVAEALAITASAVDGSHLHDRVTHVTLHRDRLEIVLKPNDAEPSPASLSVPFAWQPQQRRKGIVHEPAEQKQGIAPEQAQALLRSIAKARLWMAELIADPDTTIDTIAAREQMGERNIRKLLPLACLSPRILQALADGSAPADLTIRRLTAALRHDWAGQERSFLAR